MEAKKIIVVRVRGRVRLLTKIKDTLDMLRLYNTNYCVFIENTPANMGMIKYAKDYITWGEADDTVIQQLFEKRGVVYVGPTTDSKKKIKYDNKYVEFKSKKYMKFFRMNPPRGGYGRKGIKKPFSEGGALGYRGVKINDLIKKMM